MAVIIRDAGEGDLPAILAIHNDAVLHGTAIWSTIPVDLANRREVLAQRRAKGYAFLIADVDGAVAGYGSYGDFRPHDGYFRTVEHSIYIRPDHQRQGLASMLLVHLFDHAVAASKHVMIGGIDAGNAGSLRLHERHGFVETGRLPQVGFKFGHPLDLVFMQKMLG